MTKKYIKPIVISALIGGAMIGAGVWIYKDSNERTTVDAAGSKHDDYLKYCAKYGRSHNTMKDFETREGHYKKNQ